LESFGIEIPSALHTGGIEIRGEDVGGIAVHVAARVTGETNPGDVLVSRTVTDLVAGSGTEFLDWGSHALTSVPGNRQPFEDHPKDASPGDAR
jgi:class 3 adenylate cyclase